MRIQHNIMAMNAYRNYNNNTSALSKNLEKLSSGYKINRAGDDAAGLAISEKMRAQIKGLEAAQKNVKDGTSLVKTAEGAMQEIQDMLGRMKYLATQSSNGTYDNEVDRKALQDEVDQLKSEINRIADSANFNGIKLLDGSLSTEGAAGADSVKVAGNANAEYSTGEAGAYKADGAVKTTGSIFGTAGALGVGDTYEYGVHLADGTGYTVTLTAKQDADGKFYLEGESGAKYKLAKNGATDVKVDLTELSSAIKSELQQTGLADKYVIGEVTSGQFSFTAKEEGTSTPAVLAVDYAWTDASDATTYHNPGTKLGVLVDTQPRDVGYEIDASKLTEYNGKNYDDAVFTINGKKFVLLTEGHTGGNLNSPVKTDNTEDMHTALGLSNDVTILVGGTAGLTAGDANFDQNISAIAKATGLNVTDTIAGDGNAIAAGAGIRLTAGKGSLIGGLKLQIGDTADSYNQLRVSVDDMHTKALGIEDLNIGTGATAAIETVMKAINSVSSTRGTLGAIQNRLDHTANNLSVMVENITDAESSIRDTDVAEEMMAYTKNNILIQSAQAMLAQANAVPQGVLQLLQ